MKKAYVIAGPESSGNRMMVRAIESTMDFGEARHKYSDPNSYIYNVNWVTTMDKLDPEKLDKALEDAPDQFVFVASVPTRPSGKLIYPPMGEIVSKMISHQYRVWPIIMHRHHKYLIKSQVARKHTVDAAASINEILRSYDHLFMEYAKAKVYSYVIKYETFVTDEDYRYMIMRKVLELPAVPDMEFFNANEKYK